MEALKTESLNTPAVATRNNQEKLIVKPGRQNFPGMSKSKDYTLP